MQKAADVALSNSFYVVFDDANTGNTNASYYFIEGVLTEMAAERSSEDLSKHNHESRTQSFLSMNAFTCRGFNYLCFLRPVAKLISKICRTNPMRQNRRRKRPMIPRLSVKSPPFLLKSSDEDKVRNHTMHHRTEAQQVLKKASISRKIGRRGKKKFSIIQ